MTEQHGPAAQLSERFALYYPYIHIRDVNWLKATLLWFRQVRRIVPEQFSLKDTPEVRQFTETAGPAGPLLVEAQISEEPVAQAKVNLQKKIENNIGVLVEKYGKKKTPDDDAFQVHRYKLLEGPGCAQLPELLQSNNLAWHSRVTPDWQVWLSMHPKLGAAIMSTLGLAIARNEGLDIVTPNKQVHGTLLAAREEEVFNALLDLPSGTTPSNEDLADDLGQLVLSTQFDYSVLTAGDIKALIEEKKDLKRFRDHVAAAVSDIPSGIGPKERQSRLELKKKEILHEWDKYRRLLPKFAKKALIETSAEETAKKAAEHLPELAAAASASAVTGHIFAAAPGLCLAILVGAGIKMWRRKDSPVKFLNRVESTIEKGWKDRTANLYLPQWGKLPA